MAELRKAIAHILKLLSCGSGKQQVHSAASSSQAVNQPEKHKAISSPEEHQAALQLRMQQEASAMMLPSPLHLLASDRRFVHSPSVDLLLQLPSANPLPHSRHCPICNTTCLSCRSVDTCAVHALFSKT